MHIVLVVNSPRYQKSRSALICGCGGPQAYFVIRPKRIARRHIPPGQPSIRLTAPPKAKAVPSRKAPMSRCIVLLRAAASRRCFEAASRPALLKPRLLPSNAKSRRRRLKSHPCNGLRRFLRVVLCRISCLATGNHPSAQPLMRPGADELFRSLKPIGRPFEEVRQMVQRRCSRIAQPVSG
jgi:hypothetical protein